MLFERFFRGRVLIVLLVLVVFSSGCSQELVSSFIDLNALRTGVFDLAAALGLLMITFQGIRWIMSTQPEERDECKKAIVYVIFALIVAASVNPLVDALYCSNCDGCCTP